MERMIREVYPDLRQADLFDPSYFAGRAILTPHNATVDQINAIATQQFPGAGRQYVSADTVAGYQDELPMPLDVIQSMASSGQYSYHSIA